MSKDDEMVWKVENPKGQQCIMHTNLDEAFINKPSEKCRTHNGHDHRRGYFAW